MSRLPNYIAGNYAEGHIVYIFPFVHSFVRDSVQFMEFLQSFTLKFLKWGISHQLIRKLSYLDFFIWTIGTLEGRLSFHDS